jgi:histone acetyltransferase
VTYADNNAIEYFRKQGFTKHLQMPEARWKGYIKDYSGSTMMQCKIHKTIDYENISQTIKMQRERVINKIHSIMNTIVHSPLDFRNKGREDFSFAEITGLEPAGWTQKEYDEAKGTEEKTFEEQCDDILKALWDHENAWPFRTAVSQRQAPDYYQVITEPMWIEKIQKSVEAKVYSKRDAFKRDVVKIFENARHYNGKDTIFYKFADILQAFAQPLLDKLKETKDDTETRKQRQSQAKLDFKVAT